MRRLSPVGRRAFVWSVLALVCVVLADEAAAQGWFRRGVKYTTFRDPAGRFEFERPDKDWKSVPEGGASLAVFYHKDGAAFFVDHVELLEPMTPDEINVMPDTELELLKRQEPQAKDFKSEKLETKAGHGVLIRYSRLRRGTEAVVQYSVVVGQHLYRLKGVVPNALVPKLEPIVMHMIQSFSVRDPSSPKH